MKRMFSSFNLAMHNLWIGLCRGEAGLPRDIRSAGYQAKWIELAFQNSNNDTVHPELILASQITQHALLLDWKEGANTDEGQLARYAGVTRDDLIQRAAMPAQSAAQHDVLFVGLLENRDRLSIGLSKPEHAFPLVIVDDQGLALALNRFQPARLNASFTPRLVIDFDLIPSHLVPFDRESKDWEIAERAIPQIIKYMIDGESRFTLQDLATDIFPGWSTILAPAYRSPLMTKIKDVVSEASAREFRRYFKRNPHLSQRLGAAWDIIYVPSRQQFDRRTREYRHLASLQKQFVDGLRAGTRQYTMDI